MGVARASRMACHECDLLVNVPALEIGQKAYCPRCEYLLAAHRKNAVSKLLAFALAGLVFLLLSNSFPFLGFSAQGQERTVTLLQSVAILITENFPSLAVIVFALIIIIPGIFLLGVVYYSSSISLNRRLPGTRRILRWVL
ncbi:MAG: paraquat-inducible protein A, partial [Gammaproteobacteria bacterium]|nr:paraquat-inducible protein A [Gammaproteobacteria bacterium]